MKKGLATQSIFFLGEFHGQRSLVGYSPWGNKESDTAEQLILSHTHTSSSCLYFKCSLLDMILEMLISECSHYFSLVSRTSRAHRVNNRAFWGWRIFP